MDASAVIREFVREINTSCEAKLWSNRQNSGDQQTDWQSELGTKTRMRTRSKQESKTLDKSRVGYRLGFFLIPVLKRYV